MQEAGLATVIAKGISQLQIKNIKPVSIEIDAEFNRMVTLQGQTLEVLDLKIAGILQEINVGIQNIQTPGQEGGTQFINLPQQQSNNFDTLNAAYLDRQNLVRP